MVCMDTDSELAEAWVRAQVPLPPTATAQTAKGFHRYFYAPAGLQHFAGDDGKPEIRSGVHYSILPPSLHPSGVEYEWCELMAPDEAGIADLPQWGIDLMQVAEVPETQATAGPVEEVPEGRRNETLFRLCAKWRAADVPDKELRAAAHQWNAERCKPPLETREVDALVGSVLRYPAGTSARVQEKVRAQEYQAAEPVPEVEDRQDCDPADEAALMATAEQMVNRVPTGHDRTNDGTPPRMLIELAGDMIEDFEQERLSDRTIRGLRTGFPEMDWHYGGFARQKLIVVQGPSGYGKTTWADHCIFSTATALLAEGSPEIVAVFLLEDSKRRMIDSWMGYRYGIPRVARETGGTKHMTPEIEERLVRGYSEFPMLPIALTDDMRDIASIEAHTRDLVKEHPLAGIIVDHAQEVEVPTGRSRHEEVSQVALRLRDLADKLEVPVMLLSQTTQKDGEYHPEYSKDLRQKATLCMIVTRGEPGMTRQEAVLSNKTTVFCDKSRYCRPNAPMVLMGDWATGRLHDMATWASLRDGEAQPAGRQHDNR